MSHHMAKSFFTLQKQIRALSSLPKAKSKSKDSQCIISCKRSRLNHYNGTVYKNLEEVRLASKGWHDSRSKGDVFTINPVSEQEEGTISWNSLDVHPDLVMALTKHHIYKATLFQAEAIPLVTNSKHLMLAAETGCGKTISYVLPIIHSLIGNRREGMNTPKALVLVPNRELAYQIGEVAQTLAQAVDLNVKIVVGGRTKQLMMNPEFHDVDLVVSTPGAISKLSTVGMYKLQHVQYTVLDEADTLLDDSFIERLTVLLKRVPQSKLLLVSATVPRRLPDVLKPIESAMEQFVSPRIHKPLLNITQKFLRLTKSSKPSHLLQLAKANKQPMLVFTNRNETSNWLALFLRENGVACSNINGDMNYAIRVDQWNSFIRGDTQILSATDVGSRGLDTKHVRHVLNYDFPIYAADYLHRIGRVGRLGSSAECKATNFITGPMEVRLVQQIELAIRKNQALENVDGNITNIVQKKIQKGLGQTL